MEEARKVNSGHSNDGEERRVGARKKNRGERKKSGSLPLVMFLSLEQNSLPQNCIHASNPFHKCADHCFQGPKRFADRLLSGDNRGIGKMEEKDLHPKCANASNPFHKCAEYCNRKISEKDTSERVVTVKERKDVVDTVERKTVVVDTVERKTVERKNVLPMCPYASNPYHITCVESCLQKIQGAVVPNERKYDATKKVEGINLQPNCKHASNPYHNCAKYCTQRKSKKDQNKSNKRAVVKAERKEVAEMTEKENAHSKCVGEEDLDEGAKSEQNEEAAEVSEKNNVHPKCIEASNQYHTCNERSPEMDQDNDGSSFPAPVLLPEFISLLIYLIHLFIIAAVYNKKK